MQLLVVPRSMPIVFAIPLLLALGVVLRKSKPQAIKFLLVALALGTASVAAAAVRPGAGVVRVATDATADSGAQHATQVEPDAAAAGSTVVTVFQTGRVFEGGAAAIGFAVSGNGGRTWSPGLLPSLTAASNPPGPFARASDPVVAWDALHARWLVATLALGSSSTAIAISTSSDGSTWSAPGMAIVASRAGDGSTNLDKEWLTCDNGRSSPFFGRCYVIYSDFRRGGLAFQSSTDGGVTWTAPVTIRTTADVPGPQLAVRPNGELVIVLLGEDSVQAVHSTDGGVTFRAPETISRLSVRNHPFRRENLRVFPLPSADADAAGTVYAVWFDCRFRPSCRADDAVLARSSAGSTWTRPQRIPLVPRTSATDVVLPSLGVDPATRGRLALTYYTLAPAGCAPTACRVNAWQSSSRTGGSRWTPPRRLNTTPMRLAWLAATSSGRMVGDYFGAVVTGGRAISVVSLARAPRAGRFDQAIHALSVVAR
jgi:hypothetical protein